MVDAPTKGYLELKLGANVLNQGCLTTIPDSIQLKPVPNFSDRISSFHIDESGACFLLGEDQYDTILYDSSTKTESFKGNQSYLAISDSADKGRYMGFHEGGSPDTRYLLRDHCIIPMRFANGEMTLHPEKPVVDSQREGVLMWVVREIAPNNTLAVGYFNLTMIDIYQDTDLVRSISINGRIFGIIALPHQPMETIKLKPVNVSQEAVVEDEAYDDEEAAE